MFPLWPHFKACGSLMADRSRAV